MMLSKYVLEQNTPFKSRKRFIFYSAHAERGEVAAPVLGSRSGSGLHVFATFHHQAVRYLLPRQPVSLQCDCIYSQLL